MRVVKCDDTQRGELESFFARDPYYALFFIGNLEAMGLSHPDLDYWAQYDEQEQIVAVLLRYLTNFSILASDQDLDLTPLIEVIDGQEQVSRITGKMWIVDRIVGALQHHSLPVENENYFCRLWAEDFQPDSTEGVRQTDLADAEGIHDLFADGEFAHFTADSFRRRLTDGKCRVFATWVDERMVSAAATSAETTCSAMIGPVYTPATERGRGYASRVMSALCAALLADGKEPVLFYDNPSAGAIYRRVGFQDIGMFKMVGAVE